MSRKRTRNTFCYRFIAPFDRNTASFSNLTDAMIQPEEQLIDKIFIKINSIRKNYIKMT